MNEVVDESPPDGLTGEGLVLRPARHGDRARVLEIAHDPVQLALGMPAGIHPPRHVDDLDERIVAAQAAYAGRLPGELVVVAEDDPDRVLGTISWRHQAHPVLRIADLGYSVHPDARGRSVASRALRTLLHWLLLDPDGPGQARAQLDHSTANPASCHVALAAGMAQEGVRRGFLPLRDPESTTGVRRHDVCLHGVLPHELPTGP